MKPTRELLIAAVAIAITACAGVSADGRTDGAAAPLVAEVGALPGVVTTPTAEILTTVDETSTSSTAPIGQAVAKGDRVLMIGDSILASTASRYGGLMCSTLVPLGWQVALEAEVSRTISFARTVQRERLDEGWDAGLVFLGTNDGANATEYAATLDRVVTDFGDVPVVLVNVTQRNSAMVDINAAIADVAGRHANVVVVDWRAMTYIEPTLLNSDGIHPTGRGREALVAAVAAALGQAPPATGKADCLDSVFIDDAAGLPDGMMPTPTRTPTTTSVEGTIKPKPTTTSTSTSIATTTSTPSTTPASSSSSPPATTSPATTSPATTSPAATSPATTSPAATSPATTSPATTSP